MEKLLIDLLYAVSIALITFVGGVIAKVVIPWLKMKLESSKYAWASQIIDDAVFAFEQTLGAGNGDQKFANVLAFVKNELSSRGVNLTDEQISALIEAAVFSMNYEKDNKHEQV